MDFADLARFEEFSLTNTFSSTDFVAFSLCCLMIGTVYFHLERILTTTKRKAWIVMLVSSTMLSLFGSAYVTYAQVYQKWHDVSFIYSEDMISRAVMLFFLSSNIMDLILGLFFYPQYLDPFSTVWPNLRADLLFGISFLFTRLLYNAFLAFQLFSIGHNVVIWKVCTCVLGLHLFWFSKWLKTYGNKVVKGENVAKLAVVDTESALEYISH
eukprot:gene32470-39260_t